MYVAVAICFRHPPSPEKELYWDLKFQKVEEVDWVEQAKKKRYSDIPPNLYGNRISKRNIQKESAFGEEVLE